MLKKLYLWLGVLGAGILSTVLALIRGKRMGRDQVHNQLNEQFVKEVREHEKSENRWDNASRDELLAGLSDTPDKPYVPKS